MIYKHRQIGYLMLVVAAALLVLFAWVRFAALAETPSVDSGSNLVVTLIMAVPFLILCSYVTLTVSIDDTYLRLKFGYGLFTKKFPLKDISSVQAVKNRWYYGWGTKVWFWPYMWIYSISGLDAVQITMKNGRIYRIGTDEPQKLEAAIKQATALGS